MNITLSCTEQDSAPACAGAELIEAVLLEGRRIGTICTERRRIIEEVLRRPFSGELSNAEFRVLEDFFIGISQKRRAESIDLIDYDGALIGGSVDRRAARTLGLSTRVVHLFACCGTKVLLGKRAAGKIAAGFWDSSVGGMLQAGESVIEGLLREAREEVGRELRADSIEFLGSRLFDEEIPEGWLHEEVFHHLTRFECEFSPSTTNEVDEWIWVEASEALELARLKKTTPQSAAGLELLLDAL